jgi:aminopeptidase N
MWDDAFSSSHPIEADVTTPDQINTVFDSITYSKGAGSHEFYVQKLI